MIVSSGSIFNPIIDVHTYGDKVSIGISFDGHRIDICLSDMDAIKLASSINVAVIKALSGDNNAS